MREQAHAGDVPEFIVSCLDYIEPTGDGYSMYVLARETRSEGKVFLMPKVHIFMPNRALPDAIGKCLKIPCSEVAMQLRKLFPALNLH